MDNKSLVMEFVQSVWNEKRVDRISDYVSHDYIAYGLRSGSVVRGVEGVRENVERVSELYPDLEIHIEEILAEGDKVFALLTFESYDSTGRLARMQEMIIFRIFGNKLCEARSVGTPWDFVQS